MEYYINEIKDQLDDLVADGYESREDILKRWADGQTDDDFGNMSGSRKCSTALAEQDLQAAGFPFNYEINDLLNDAGYEYNYLIEKGPEVTDVIICELIAMRWAAEQLEK